MFSKYAERSQQDLLALDINRRWEPITCLFLEHTRAKLTFFLETVLDQIHSGVEKLPSLSLYFSKTTESTKIVHATQISISSHLYDVFDVVFLHFDDFPQPHPKFRCHAVGETSVATRKIWRSIEDFSCSKVWVALVNSLRYSPRQGEKRVEMRRIGRTINAASTVLQTVKINDTRSKMFIHIDSVRWGPAPSCMNKWPLTWEP
jgi:hypothetical protein